MRRVRTRCGMHDLLATFWRRVQGSSYSRCALEWLHILRARDMYEILYCGYSTEILYEGARGRTKDFVLNSGCRLHRIT